MKYQVTVTEREPGKDKDYDRHQTIFQQSFEELDLAELAIFLNQQKKTDIADLGRYCDQYGAFTTNEPSVQGMPS